MDLARRAFESSHGRQPVVSSTCTCESPRRGRLRPFENQRGLPTGHTYSNLLVHVIFSAYIARQEEHHRRVTFEEELRAFLDRHGIPYDPDHMLD